MSDDAESALLDFNHRQIGKPHAENGTLAVPFVQQRQKISGVLCAVREDRGLYRAAPLRSGLFLETRSLELKQTARNLQQAPSQHNGVDWLGSRRPWGGGCT